MTKPEKTGEQGVFATVRSLQFGIVLLIAIVAVAVVGTLIPQQQPPEFYREHFGGIVNMLVTVFRFDITYRSPLFIGLLSMLGINLVLCSLVRFPSLIARTFRPDLTPGRREIETMPVRRTVQDLTVPEIAAAFARSGMRMRKVGENRLFGESGSAGYLGSSLVHLSLLLFLAGGFASMLTAERGYLMLEPGQTASDAVISQDHTIPLGFSVTLDRFEVEFYEDHPGRPKKYTSYVTVTEPGLPAYTRDIRVNHPLMRHGFTVYQSSYGPLEQQTSSSGDVASVAVSLKGAPDQMPPIMTLQMVMGETYRSPVLATLYRCVWPNCTVIINVSAPYPVERIPLLKSMCLSGVKQGGVCLHSSRFRA